MIQPPQSDILPAPLYDTPALSDAPAPEQADLEPDAEELLRLKYPPIPNHPLARLRGSFDNEPLWDEFRLHVLEYREKQNEIEDD